MKNNVSFAIIIVITLVVLGIAYSAVFYRPLIKRSQNAVCIEKNCFNAEIVSTPEARQRGLMNRTFMDEDNGMLFIFDNPGVYPFWMKDTLIPLDMIWLDSNKRVVYIYQNAEPCVSEPCQIINPGVPALYVLEINGGRASELGIKIGDKVTFGHW